MLASWWDTIEHLYGNRILALDQRAAEAAGHLKDYARSLGRDPGFADIAILAIAQVHGHAIATRNLKHFNGLGVTVFDPSASCA